VAKPIWRRARLFEAAQTSSEQLRAALIAGRAAPWRIDLLSMTSVRDPAYCALLGLRDRHGAADFEAIHPDDRAAMKAAFERTLRIRARAAGFDHHLVKPIEFDALLPLLGARN
jgi:PAS domain-containing protein